MPISYWISIACLHIQIPSIFFLLLGIFMWVNFSWVDSMFLYYPVVLIFVTVVMLFVPLKVFYHHSRLWWAVSNVSFHFRFAFLQEKADLITVATLPCRLIPCRVSRFLPGRYVLFPDVCYGCKSISILSDGTQLILI